MVMIKLHYFLSFNPRPRMGGDYLAQQNTRVTESFNPRPRMGGDQLS